MSKIKTLFDLILYVNRKRSFAAREVAEEFGISVRTAHRYLLELTELGVPLYTDQGRNGGYRTLKNRVLPPVIFTEDEAYAIFFAFRSLKFYNALPFDLDINTATSKLHAIMPEDTKDRLKRWEEVFCFWNQKRSVATPFLKEIIEASLDQHRVVIEYQSKSGNKVKEVDPIGVYASNGFWYMPAFDLDYGEVRLFRVDRILTVQHTKTKFDAPTDLANWFTTRANREPVRLHVKLTREGVRQCLGEPWLEPHIVRTGQDEGYIDIEIDKSELDFLTGFFFGLGTDVTILEPVELAYRIKLRAKSILDHYQ